MSMSKFAGQKDFDDAVFAVVAGSADDLASSHSFDGIGENRRAEPSQFFRRSLVEDEQFAADFRERLIVRRPRGLLCNRRRVRLGRCRW